MVYAAAAAAAGGGALHDAAVSRVTSMHCDSDIALQHGDMDAT
jgi:hypothetical protein